jgi:hypothetical protein
MQKSRYFWFGIKDAGHADIDCLINIKNDNLVHIVFRVEPSVRNGNPFISGLVCLNTAMTNNEVKRILGASYTKRNRHHPAMSFKRTGGCIEVIFGVKRNSNTNQPSIQGIMRESIRQGIETLINAITAVRTWITS